MASIPGWPVISPSRIDNPEDYILTDQGDNEHLPFLSKHFANAGKRVHVSDIFEDGNHKVSEQCLENGGDGLAWEPQDQETSKWVPQGITSTSDALKDGDYQGKEGWIVSWYKHDKHSIPVTFGDKDSVRVTSVDKNSVRVTFVDRATKKYRHVLLVEPHMNDDFKAVDAHAGGIVWYGDTLWVVDSKHAGIRVFDMENIWEVGDGKHVGKEDDGKGYSAAGYKYVIPQIRWYKWSPKSPSSKFQFSFVSLDRTDPNEPDSLLVGEWDPSGDDARLMQWDLDYKTRKLKTGDGSGVAKARIGYRVGIDSMQGALRVKEKVFISRTHGHENGDMFGWVPGQKARLNREFFPPGPEDLSYDGKRDKIYTVTELEKRRYIVTADPDRVKFYGY